MPTDQEIALAMANPMEKPLQDIGQTYGGLSMPQRPIDAIMQERQPTGQTDGAALIEAMMMQRNPGLEMQSAPTIGQTPQELGIGPSPEWLAQSDARMGEIDQMRDEGAFQRAMAKAAYKLKMQEHSDEFNSPEVQADALASRRAWLAERGS